MTKCCDDDLVAFADGELDGAGAVRTRRHLAECERCQREFIEVVQLSAMLSELLPSKDNVRHVRSR